MAAAFRENGIEFEQVNYYIDPLTVEKLRSLLKKAGIEPFQVLRKREKTYKELGLSADTPPDELISLIIEHPNLLERPIVEIGEKAVLARPIERGIELIEQAG